MTEVHGGLLALDTLMALGVEELFTLCRDDRNTLKIAIRNVSVPSVDVLYLVKGQPNQLTITANAPHNRFGLLLLRNLDNHAFCDVFSKECNICGLVRISL